MIVCLCEAVSDEQVKSAVYEGSDTVKQVGSACGAGTDCGMCCREIRTLIREMKTGIPQLPDDPPNR